jgi:hypothetical protein
VSQALLELPNVIGTPHAAASSREGLDRTNMVAARAIVAVLDGDDPRARVCRGRRPRRPLGRPGTIMELDWLEDFLALVEHQHFGRAAEARNVSQPAFSRRIRLLETWLGAPLFNRDTHRVALTPGR